MNDLVNISVILAHKTPKAILVKKDEDDKNGIWLPLSRVEYDPSDARAGTIILLTLPEWLALNEGLI